MKTKKYIPLLIIIAVLTLTIGFSSFYATTSINNISALIEPHADVRITSFSQKSTTNSGSSSYNTYTDNTVSSRISLPNTNSTVKYEVKITNLGNVEVGILDITGLPSDLKMSGYTLKTMLCDDTISNQCTSSSVSKIEITIEYDPNGNYTSTTYDLNLTFIFKQAYTITYSGFSSTSGLPTSILDTEVKTITFNSTTGIPDNVTVTGATSSYTSPNLTLSNATQNVTVTNSNSSGGNGGTWETPVEDTTTTVYDPDNVVEGTTIYTSVDGTPKVTADENGNITRFEYTDTGENGVSVPSGGLDTGVLAFDGNDFTVTLKAVFTFANCQTSICPVISASKKDPTVNGILIYEMGKQTSGYGHTSSGTNVTTPYNKFRYGKYQNSSSAGNVDYNIINKVTSSSMNGRYGYNTSSTATESKSPVTLTFKLYYTNGVFSSEIYESSGSTDTLLAKPYNNTTYSFTNLDSSFDNITVVVGEYDGFGEGVTYTHTFNILEFSVIKDTN